MAKGKSESEGGQGTFAQLYDVQEQLSRRNSKPLGRPPKKVQRKPTTIHFTQSENRNLSKLQLQVNEYFSINRSELTGIAVDLLAVLMETTGDNLLLNGDIDDVEAFRQSILDFIKS